METTGLKKETCRIIAIGCKANEEIKVFMHEEEKQLLQDFWDYVDKVEPDRFVGFNNHLFDDPFLFHRTIHAGVDSGFPLLSYSKSVDLRSLLTVFQKRVYGKNFSPGKLPEFCKSLDIQVDCDECMGDKMPGLWANRKEHPENLDEIREHAYRDIQRTHELYMKVRRFL